MDVTALSQWHGISWIITTRRRIEIEMQMATDLSEWMTEIEEGRWLQSQLSR